MTNNYLLSIVSIFLLLFENGQLIAETTSTFEPPKEKLGVYVKNNGSGLDTGCSFRSEGPLLITIPIPMVINSNKVDSDGKLIDPNSLIKDGIIGAYATIRFPVFDIDSDTEIDPPYYNEVDSVTFNGKFEKNLSGIDGQWTDDSILVPISEIKFGKDNELRIDIDTANSEELWCMAVDWVSIEFDATAPYVLAHGINSDASSWNDVVDELDDKGVLYKRFSVTPNGSSLGNSRELEYHIKNFLTDVKSDKVNIIAHSKGGLDAQMLKARSPSFKILSLSTLSTPHLGSVAADLSTIQKTIADEKYNVGDDPNGFASLYITTWTFGQGPQFPGLDDLRVSIAAQDITMGLRGNIKPTYSIGANADLNKNNDLEYNESSGLFPSPWATNYAAQRSWRVLRDFSSAPILSIVKITSSGITKNIMVYDTVLSKTPQDNDIVVTRNSANPFYSIKLGDTYSNHSTVKNDLNVYKILLRTIPLR